MTMIDVKKKYRTRNGRDVTIVSTRGNGRYPIIAIIHYDDRDECESLTDEGKASTSGMGHDHDLIEVKPKLKGFANIYRGVCYPSKGAADTYASPDRIACIDLSDYEKGHGL
jgi:hypothetical protein